MATPRARSIGNLSGIPGWRRVPSAELSTVPWNALCLVQVRDQFGPRETGTGWLAAPHTVVTAAHVVADALSAPGFAVRLTFPFTAPVDAIECIVHESHGKASGSPFDPFDIAALRVDIAGASSLGRESLTAADGRVEIGGFPEQEAGALVTHVAPMKRLDGVVRLHPLDTAGGHSGAPVFSRAEAGSTAVIATHIGNFNTNPAPALGQWNVALLMRRELQDFIETRVREWTTGGQLR